MQFHCPVRHVLPSPIGFAVRVNLLRYLGVGYSAMSSGLNHFMLLSIVNLERDLHR